MVHSPYIARGFNKPLLTRYTPSAPDDSYPRSMLLAPHSALTVITAYMPYNLKVQNFLRVITTLATYARRAGFSTRSKQLPVTKRECAGGLCANAWARVCVQTFVCVRARVCACACECVCATKSLLCLAGSSALHAAPMYSTLFQTYSTLTVIT